MAGGSSVGEQVASGDGIADIVVETRNERVENTVRHVISAINRFYDNEYKRKD